MLWDYISILYEKEILTFIQLGFISNWLNYHMTLKIFKMVKRVKIVKIIKKLKKLIV